MSRNTISQISYSAAKYETEFPWVEADPASRRNARCKICLRIIRIDSMGRSALVSHANGKKHLQNQRIQLQTPPISALLKQPVITDGNCTPAVVELSSTAEPTRNMSSTLLEKEAMEKISNRCELSSEQHSPNIRGSNAMKLFLQKEEVTKAEIILCLYSVVHHISLRSIGDLVTLCPSIFPDSEIIKRLQLQKDKVKYTVVYGIAPYFKKKLESIVDNCSHLVMGFDESLNRIAQRQQMDLTIRYWCDETNEVATRYLDSIFLGHTRAEDLRRGFKAAVQEKNLGKVIQIGMDGPNVNFKMLDDLCQELKLSSNNYSELLNMGSCGIHSTHGGFKAGINASKWNLMEVFRAAYYFFRDSPARRQDYFEITGSQMFPLKICDVRWIENGKISRRFTMMLDSLKAYVAFLEKISKEQEIKKREKEQEKNKKREKMTEEERNLLKKHKALLTVLEKKNYQTIAAAVKDKLLRPKLAFFEFLCTEMEPFLTAFQSDSPMAPFLFNDLSGLFQSFAVRVIKPGVLEKSSIANLDLSNKENLLDAKKIDLGFATRDALKNTPNLKDIDFLTFRQDCRNILVAIIKKMQERSPLNHKLTEYISCLNPVLIYDHPNTAFRRLTKCLDVLVTKKWISCTKAENAKKEFTALSNSPHARECFKNYRRSDCRLDRFWLNILRAHCHSLSLDLFDFVKIVLILSHGNAALERGFSINKECLVENLQEKSLIAQRLIHDAVPDLKSIIVDKTMLHAARNSHALYKEDLLRKAQEMKGENDRKEAKRKATKDLEEMKTKKSKLLMEVSDQAAYYDERISQLNAIIYN